MTITEAVALRTAELNRLLGVPVPLPPGERAVYSRDSPLRMATRFGRVAAGAALAAMLGERLIDVKR